MPRTRTERSVLLWGAGLILLQLGFRAWAVYGGWFQFDDFAFLSRAYNQPLDWAYLTESYAGHLMPAGFLLTWLFADYEPMTFWPYATTLLAMQVVASVGFFRLLLHMFGRRLAVLPLLTIYLFSVISLPAFIWWAAGINQLPFLIALFFGLHSHISYLRTRQLRYVASTLAWTVFGLLFYEKTLLVFLAYGLVALCYFAKGAGENRFSDLWATYRPGILLHGLLLVGYLVIYLATSLNFDPNNANQTPLFPVAYRFIFVAFTTGVAGGPWQWRDIDPVGTVANPSEVVVFCSWAALGYLGYLAYRSRVNTVRAWSMTGAFLILNVVLLAAARAFLAGPDIGLEYRYQTEMSAIFALSVGLAFLRFPGAVETSSLRDETQPPLFSGRHAALTSLAFLVAAGISNVQYVAHWHGNDKAQTYFDNARAGLESADRPVPLVNGQVPQFIMWGFRFPENSYRHVFAPYADRTRYLTSATDKLLVFDNAGRLRAATVSPVRRNVPAADRRCGYRVDGPETLRIPLDGPVIGGGWWVRLGYLADGDGTVTVTAGERVHEIPVEKGLHAMFFRADGEFEQIKLSGLDEGTSLCTNDVTLGVPEPLEQ